MIVKLQLSISTNASNRQMLIYDKSRKYQYQSDAPKEVIEVMNGRLKAFYKAKLVGTEIEFIEEAPDPGW